MLSIWWPVGQLVASLSELSLAYPVYVALMCAAVAWGFLTNYSCEPTLLSCKLTAPGVTCCSRELNKGWRYLNITMGALTFLMFVCRFFFFHLYESPKFLLSRGRQAEAVATVHGIAYSNKRKTWLTEEILNDIGGDPAVVSHTKLTTAQIIRRQLGKFSKERIAPLFATRRLGIMSTYLLWPQIDHTIC